MLESYIEEKKSAIADYLKTQLAQHEGRLTRINPFGGDVCRRLGVFALNGKMIRGTLVALSYGLARNDEPDEVISVGAAVELIQSALIVHDDIMDHDQIRRGRKSLYYQYVETAQKNQLSDPLHTGESLGICAGDIAFFLAFEILAALDNTRHPTWKLLRVVAEELAHVGIAQMQDVYWGASSRIISENEILDLYKYKTGRYTFSLPLVLGAMLAGLDDARIQLLERLGERYGTIFQIRDDELGLFGQEKELGKPVGSDIRSAKKTIYHHYLMRKASKTDSAELSRIFGNSEANVADIQYVRETAENLGIIDDVNLIVDEKVKEAQILLDSLGDLDPQHIALLHQMLDYIKERDK